MQRILEMDSFTFRINGQIVETLELNVLQIKRLSVSELHCEKTGLSGFPTRSNTYMYRALQSQKMARCLEFRI